MGTMYKELLSPGERAAAWRLGAFSKFAEIGVRPGQVDEHIKAAAGAATLVSPAGMAKMIATMAVLTGVPLGVAAHIVGQRVSAVRAKEEDLETQTKYYRNAASQLEHGLAASGA